MSRIYKQTSFTSDDLFATVSFGGGGGGGGGSRSRRLRSPTSSSASGYLQKVGSANQNKAHSGNSVNDFHGEGKIDVLIYRESTASRNNYNRDSDQWKAYEKCMDSVDSKLSTDIIGAFSNPNDYKSVSGVLKVLGGVGVAIDSYSDGEMQCRKSNLGL